MPTQCRNWKCQTDGRLETLGPDVFEGAVDNDTAPPNDHAGRALLRADLKASGRRASPGFPSPLPPKAGSKVTRVRSPRGRGSPTDERAAASAEPILKKPRPGGALSMGSPAGIDHVPFEAVACRRYAAQYEAGLLVDQALRRRERVGGSFHVLRTMAAPALHASGRSPPQPATPNGRRLADGPVRSSWWYRAVRRHCCVCRGTAHSD